MKAITLLIITVLLMACFGTKPDKTNLDGTSLPAFSLLLPDSTTWLNTANIPTGKPSVLFQFNPYCPYCKNQMKDIIKKINELKQINFYLITLFPFKDMKAWHEEFQLSKYSNIITGQDTASFAADYFDAAGVPYTAIYDKNKLFTHAFTGEITSKQILSAVNEKH